MAKGCANALIIELVANQPSLRENRPTHEDRIASVFKLGRAGGYFLFALSVIKISFTTFFFAAIQDI